MLSCVFVWRPMIVRAWLSITTHEESHSLLCSVGQNVHFCLPDDWERFLGAEREYVGSTQKHLRELALEVTESLEEDDVAARPAIDDKLGLPFIDAHFALQRSDLCLSGQTCFGRMIQVTSFPTTFALGPVACLVSEIAAS